MAEQTSWTNNQTAWVLTRKVQAVLGVRQDGIWGPNTDTAYHAAADIVRKQIDAQLAELRYSRESLRSVTLKVREGGTAKLDTGKAKSGIVLVSATGNRPPEKEIASDNWLTFEELQPILKEAVVGLKHATLEIMTKKLNLEAGKRRRNGVIEYNARSVNGSYRGLFQMGRDAWSDIQAKLGFGYDKVFDPRINAKAAALYVENNVRVARAKGYTGPITDDVVYTMHNQGVGGFMRILRGGHVEGNQSAAAKRVIASARNNDRLV